MANEKRLIDANAFFDKLEKLAELMKQGKIGEIDLNLLIASMPTVEVVHGRWLTSHTVAFSEECSQCGFCVPWDDDGMLHKYNYCPNCGAKMDGDGNADV